jgi:hypothetical protein
MTENLILKYLLNIFIVLCGSRSGIGAPSLRLALASSHISQITLVSTVYAFRICLSVLYLS